MCCGHPRSIASVLLVLQRSHAVATLDSLITQAGQEIRLSSDDVFRYRGLQYLCPVLLDIRIAGWVADGTTTKGLELVMDGFYVNRFAGKDNQFIPTSTAWQLKKYLAVDSQRPHEVGVQQRGGQVINTLAQTRWAIRRDMVDTRPTNIDDFLPRALHLRAEAVRFAPAALALFQATTPTFTIVRIPGDDADNVGLFNVQIHQTYNVWDVAALRRGQVEMQGEAEFVNCWEYPDGSIEQRQDTQVVIVKPQKPNNEPVDFAMHLWTRHDGQRVQVKVWGQNKQGGHKYLTSRRNIRIAPHKMQELVKEKFSRPSGELQILLVLALVCTDKNDIDVLSVVHNVALHEEFTYTDHEEQIKLPKIDYPVIVLGRDDVFGTLGSSFTNYIRNFFVGALVPDVEQKPQQASSSKRRRS